MFLKKNSVIIFSVFAVLLVTGLILFLSFTSKPEPVSTHGSTGEEFLASSDAVAGRNNSEIDKAMVASDAQGYYLDDSDGWYYDLVFDPVGDYDGTFSAGFDASHKASENNPQKDFTALGQWKLENGEIKLFSEGVYRSSMWLCEGYIVDSLNYFVGKIRHGEKLQQTVLVSKAGESGDTQVFNLYSDGKVIMEIIRNDGKLDFSGTEEDRLPKHQMIAGTYNITKDKVTIILGDSAQQYYVVNDGIAKWKYIKKN